MSITIKHYKRLLCYKKIRDQIEEKNKLRDQITKKDVSY